MAYITKDQLLKLINEMAPFADAESWDNVGLLISSAKSQYKKVIAALELSEYVVDQAIAQKADAIVTHHPVMLTPIKKLDDATEESRCIRKLVRHDIAHIAAHTNLDASDLGTNAQLAARLGFEHVELLSSKMGRVGIIVPITLRELAEKTDDILGFGGTRFAGDENAVITRAAIVTGSGMSLAEEAYAAGAQVLITGDARHHNAAEALGKGLCIIDAGHFETERPAMAAVIEGLQSRYIALQCNVADAEFTEFCLADERRVLQPLT